MHHAIAVDSVFAALADPTRRALLERLAKGQTSASQLAKELPITRQAIAKHMQILKQAGLVSPHKVGKQLCFSVEPAQLAATGRWMQRAAERFATSNTEVANTAS